MGKHVRNLCFVLVVGLIGIVAFEFLAQMVFPEKIRFIKQGISAYARNGGYKPCDDPACPRNSDGLRGLNEPADIKDDDVSIIFLGDSFVFGHRQPADNSLPALIEKKARAEFPQDSVHVSNFGWVSASPVLSFELLKEIGDRYKPDTVVLLLDMSDFHDDIKYSAYNENQTILTLKEYVPATYIVLNQIHKTIWSGKSIASRFADIPADRFFITNQPLAESRRHMEATAQNIRRIASYSESELNARFVLVSFPRNYQYSEVESPNNWEKDAYEVLGKYSLEPFRFLDSEFGGGAFPYFSLLEVFQNTEAFPTTFEDDPHWTRLGTQVAADAIFEFCRKIGCFQKNRP